MLPGSTSIAYVDCSLDIVTEQTLFYRATRIEDVESTEFDLDDLAFELNRNTEAPNPVGVGWLRNSAYPEWANFTYPLTWTGQEPPYFYWTPFSCSGPNAENELVGRGVRYNAPEWTCGRDVGQQKPPPSWPTIP